MKLYEFGSNEKWVKYEEAHAIELERDKLKSELEEIKGRRCENCKEYCEHVNHGDWCQHHGFHATPEFCCESWKART